MADYTYEANAHWTGGRRGTVTGQGADGPVEFSAPPEFQGDSGKWTPEHFFAAAIASCMVTTFRAIAEISRFEFAGLDVSVEAVLEKAEGGFRFTRVTVKPVLTVHSEDDRGRGLRLLDKAERACLISRSINAQITLQPTVMVATVHA